MPPGRRVAVPLPDPLRRPLGASFLPVPLLFSPPGKCVKTTVHSAPLLMCTVLGGEFMARRRRPSNPFSPSPGNYLPRGGRELYLFATRLALVPRPTSTDVALLRAKPSYPLAVSRLRTVRTVVNQARPNQRRSTRLPHLAAGQVRLLRSERPLKPARETPCQRRETRRQVMFSKQVAGRRWSGGGPRMQYASRTINSDYTCR